MGQCGWPPTEGQPEPRFAPTKDALAYADCAAAVVHHDHIHRADWTNAVPLGRKHNRERHLATYDRLTWGLVREVRRSAKRRCFLRTDPRHGRRGRR